MDKKCSTCGKEVKNRYSEFVCPQCEKEKIVRCESCRSLAAQYVCKNCEFSGP